MGSTNELFINPDNPDAWGPMSHEALADEHDREGLPHGWLDHGNASELSLLINAKFPDKDLDRLVEHAVEAAATEDHPDTMPPEVLETARNAVAMALGLKPYPEQFDGVTIQPVPPAVGEVVAVDERTGRNIIRSENKFGSSAIHTRFEDINPANVIIPFHQ